jgi:hypothetical protein
MMTGWTMGPDGWLWLGAWIAALAVMAWLLVRMPASRTKRDEIVDDLRRETATVHREPALVSNAALAAAVAEAGPAADVHAAHFLVAGAHRSLADCLPGRTP